MTTIANVCNWHRYIIALLLAFEAVCAAIVAGAVVVPPGLHDVAQYAGLANVFLVAFLPRVQRETGPGAPPILSPPPKPE